jgi:RHS repeat-associated protein
MQWINLGDSVFVKIENGMQSNFRIQNDTLYWAGYENPLLRVEDSIAPIMAIKSSSKHNSITSAYHFKGMYCGNNYVGLIGHFAITTGGKGLLILPDDTLSDVMPVLITNKFSVKVSNTPQIDNMVSPPDNLLPYGGLMGAAGSGVQPRKYGGKELDRENGLDWYDSQARHYDPTAGRTPTMDSKAESYYSLSPYLWCAGNPVRNIDPDGSFVRKNTHYNESYPYVVVFPMNYKNPENGPSLEPDFLAAERIGTPILLVKDAQDFADALDMYPEHGFKGFVINSHGDSGEFLIGETNITTGDEDQMKILKDGLKGKSVFIEACNTGAGNKGKEFTVKFARLTQSTTITSRHNILMGYNYRGGLGLTFASSFEKFLWKLGFNLGNDYRISENGSKARNIYHLSIDINDGFEWEDFGNECIIPLYYDD